jgi:hypothetical protein
VRCWFFFVPCVVRSALTQDGNNFLKRDSAERWVLSSCDAGGAIATLAALDLQLTAGKD